jgi:hypothetical protein
LPAKQAGSLVRPTAAAGEAAATSSSSTSAIGDAVARCRRTPLFSNRNDENVEAEALLFSCEAPSCANGGSKLGFDVKGDNFQRGPLMFAGDRRPELPKLQLAGDKGPERDDEKLEKLVRKSSHASERGFWNNDLSAGVNGRVGLANDARAS